MNSAQRILAPSVVLLAAASLASAQVSFPFERTDLTAAHTPAHVVAGDLDGDGAPELLATSTQAGRVTLWTNLGDGSFAPGFDVVAVTEPIAAAVGHLDGDGLLDLAVLSDVTDSVSLYLGVGDGSFAAAGSVAVPGELLSLALADLTGDGSAEVLVSERTSDTLYVAENAGDGGFAPVAAHATFGSASNIVVGDLNGDGDPDVVTSSYDEGDWGSILLGAPGLTFEPPGYVSSSYGGQPYWVDLGDMDGDGVLDLVTCEDDGFDRDTILWPGQGDGTFGGELWYSLSFAYPSLQTVGDYNGDGVPDVAVRNSLGEVRGLANPGTGELQQDAITPTGIDVVALATADLDGDGNDDLVTANADDTTLSVLLSRPVELSGWNSKLLLAWPLPQKHLMAFKQPALANELYWVVGSASGTTPGLVVDGVPIPLNLDGYSQFTLAAPNTWIANSLGLLGPTGAATATLEILGSSLSPSLAGLTLKHAFLVFDVGSGQLVYASDTLAVSFV